MNTAKPEPTRRQFLVRASAAAGIVAGRLPWVLAGDAAKPAPRKTALSFYCDDTNPYVTGAKPFRAFLDYCAEHRIAGESTAILGTSGHSMCRNPDEEEAEFLRQVARAWHCGIGTHMELMTHRGLFDFDANHERKDAPHEGLWLHEPAITVGQYERYFASIIAEGARAGVKFTGLTWPGCACAVCTRRYAELRARGHKDPNPSIWTALLNLAGQGKFRGRTVPCFFGTSETEYGIHRKAADGRHAVYDLMPNAMDWLGSWDNNPAHVDPDYYITADGKSGIVVRHVQAGAPYCLWYSHWQGFNPAKGVGWRAFTTVVERIGKYLGDRVVWMRPSEITDGYHAAGDWAFLEAK
jgi:hypothetical protein